MNSYVKRADLRRTKRKDYLQAKKDLRSIERERLVREYEKLFVLIYAVRPKKIPLGSKLSAAILSMSTRPRVHEYYA